MSKLEFRFRSVEAFSHDVDARALSEGQFLAGEDAAQRIFAAEEWGWVPRRTGHKARSRMNKEKAHMQNYSPRN